MSHTILGRLQGRLWGDHDEPLAGMAVRLYSAGVAGAGNGPPAAMPRILDAGAVEARSERLLVEVTTYPDGAFVATLPEGLYDGGAVEVDVRCHTVPGLPPDQVRREPVQVHVTTLQPDWAGGPYWELSCERSLPVSTWLAVRALFGAWVVCGRVIESDSGVAVAGATVRAFDTDWLQDDPLGATTTDYCGDFRLDYNDRDFRRTPLSPLVNVELVAGPDLYFRVESYTGATLLDEARSAGRAPGRRDVGRCTWVELDVAGPAPQPRLYEAALGKRRHEEILSSFDDGRAPIATNGDVFYRPNELLIGRQAFEVLRTELEERYGARPYDPEDPDGWRVRYRAARERRAEGVRLPVPERPLAFGRRPAPEGPLQLYVLRSDLDPATLVTVVRTLRSRVPEPGDDPEYGVHLNHVLFPEPIYQGGPDGDPSPYLGELEPSTPVGPLAPHLAVLDTGVWADLDRVHNGLASRLIGDLDDIDDLSVAPPPGLDTCAGHGVFICGLVHRMYPDLRMDPGRVLDSSGGGDDMSIENELGQNLPRVINLSLGCHTENDKEPPELAPTIRAMIASGFVVVAAAGNNPNGGTQRPFWPAAMPEVIAVGSWDTTVSTEPIAFTSNRGPWVDVYAPGVDRVSAYVDGQTPKAAGVPFNGSARWSGTSFAAPHVAAEIAEVARNGTAPAAVAAELLSTGQPRSLPNSQWPGNSGRWAKLYDNRHLTE